MLNLDPAKLFVILVIAFVVLGPERLPRVARQLGAAWHELTRIRSEVTDEVRSAFPVDQIPHIPNASAAVSNFVSGFTNPLRSALNGDPVPGANSAATSSSDDAVIANIEGEHDALEHDPGQEVMTDERALRDSRAEVAVEPGEDWSLLADHPSMN